MLFRKRKFVNKKTVTKPIGTITLPSAPRYAPTEAAKVDVVWSIHNLAETISYIQELAGMDIGSNGKWYEKFCRYMEREYEKGARMLPVRVVSTGKGVANRIQQGVGLDNLREEDYDITIVFTGLDEEEFSTVTSDLDYIPKQDT